MKRLAIILGSLALALSACSSKDDNECSEAAPTCSDNTITACIGGKVVDEPCGAGTQCTVGADGPLCVPEGEEFCDPQTTSGTCITATSARICGSDGITQTTECSTGTVCARFEDGAQLGCIPEGSEVCDPTDFEPSCDGDDLVMCTNQGGFHTTSTSCAPFSCRVGSAGAVCVPADAEECDFSGTQCFDGNVAECVDGFAREVAACGATDLCIIDECFPADVHRCGPTSKPLCGANGREECDEAYTVYRESACGAGTTCAADPLLGATCLAADEVACDPATYAPNCVDDTTARRCIESASMTLTTTCGAGESCQTTDTGAWCVPADAEVCDPLTYDATCSGATATTCDIQKHVVVSFDCGAGTVCLDDDFGNLYKLAGCYPDGLPDCTEPSHQGCANSVTRQWCLGGKLVTQPCAPGDVCYGGGLRAECRPATAAACSVFEFEDICEDASTLRECFAGYEIVTNCDRVGGRCDATAGACAY